jgi:hypothetical protein
MLLILSIQCTVDPFDHISWPQTGYYKYYFMLFRRWVFEGWNSLSCTVCGFYVQFEIGSVLFICAG